MDIKPLIDSSVFVAGSVSTVQSINISEEENK